MTTSLRFTYSLFAMGLLMGASLAAQEQASSPDVGESRVAQGEGSVAPGESPSSEPVAEKKAAEIHVERDRGFDLYIDKNLLQNAIKSLDAELLTDLALQFVQGERVLFRSHKSISAEEVLKLALQVASEKQDARSLERLEHAINLHGNQDLITQFKVARQFASSSRAVDPAMMVSIDSMTPKAFAAYRAILRDIDSMRLRGEVDELTKLRERVPQLEDLGAAERKLIEQRIDAALESAAESDSSAIDKLSLLSAPSRGGKYAAIAYSRRNKSSGYSWNASSRARAEEIALDNCSGSDARIIMWGKNTYIAFAVNKRTGRWGTGRSTKKATAQRQAINNSYGGILKKTIYSGRS